MVTNGRVKWCGVVRVWGKRNSKYAHYGDSVSGRREPLEVSDSGQWEVGDIIEFVLDCDGKCTFSCQGSRPELCDKRLFGFEIEYLLMARLFGIQ